MGVISFKKKKKKKKKKQKRLKIAPRRWRLYPEKVWGRKKEKKEKEKPEPFEVAVKICYPGLLGPV